eukprot:scaffold204647_cov13-Tisochrysis_lutea.AAC.1
MGVRNANFRDFKSAMSGIVNVRKERQALLKKLWKEIEEGKTAQKLASPIFQRGHLGCGALKVLHD